MCKKGNFWLYLTLTLAVVIMAGLKPAGALAQCGGDHSNMYGQHMGSSGHMGSGQMGRYGQAPVQPDQNAVAPGYAAPAPPVAGYAAPQQDAGGYGQSMGQGSAGSGHSGHMGH